MQLWTDDEDSEEAYPGANVKMKLKNVEEDVSVKMSKIKNRKKWCLCHFWIDKT